MSDFAVRLEKTYVYRRPHSSTEALFIALSEAAEANVLGRGYFSTRENKLCLLNTFTAMRAWFKFQGWHAWPYLVVCCTFIRTCIVLYCSFI